MSELVDEIWLARELGLPMAEFQKRALMALTDKELNWHTARLLGMTKIEYLNRKARIIEALKERAEFDQYRTDLALFHQYRLMLKDRLEVDQASLAPTANRDSSVR